MSRHPPLPPSFLPRLPPAPALASAEQRVWVPRPPHLPPLPWWAPLTSSEHGHGVGSLVRSSEQWRLLKDGQLQLPGPADRKTGNRCRGSRIFLSLRVLEEGPRAGESLISRAGGHSAGVPCRGAVLRVRLGHGAPSQAPHCPAWSVATSQEDILPTQME